MYHQTRSVVSIPALIMSLCLFANISWGASMAQHDTSKTGAAVFGSDVEAFGVSDNIQFTGIAEHELNIAGGPAVHTNHNAVIGDLLQFTTSLEFSAQRLGIDDGDGRPLFVPTGEGTLVTENKDTLNGISGASRAIQIRLHDTLLGNGQAAGDFDFSQAWSISVVDGIQQTTQTTNATLGLSGGGVSGGVGVSVTTILNSPTTVTVAKPFDDLFEFELTQPQAISGTVNDDAKQGYFAEGGTVTITGFIKAKRVGTGFVWMNNNTAVSFDQIFESPDPDGLFPDSASGDGVGDLLLRDQLVTVPWDKFTVTKPIPEPNTLPLIASFLPLGMGCRSFRD